MKKLLTVLGLLMVAFISQAQRTPDLTLYNSAGTDSAALNGYINSANRRIYGRDIVRDALLRQQEIYSADTPQLKIGVSDAANLGIRYQSATNTVDYHLRTDAVGTVPIHHFNGHVESVGEYRAQYSPTIYTTMQPTSDGKLVVSQTGGSAPEWYFNTPVYFNSTLTLAGGSTGMVLKKAADGTSEWANLDIPPILNSVYNHITVGGSGDDWQINSTGMTAIIDYFLADSSLTLAMFAAGEFEAFASGAVANGDAAPVSGDVVYDYLTGTPSLGTPSALVLTNATGLPVGGITGLGTGVGTWLGTPTSANLAAALTNETGTGNAVFSASPTFTGTLNAADVTATGNGLFSTLRTNTSSALSSSSVEMITIGGTINHTGTAQSTALAITPYYQSSGSGGDYLIVAGNRTAAYPSGTNTNVFAIAKDGYTWSNQGFGATVKTADPVKESGVIKMFHRMLAGRGMGRQVSADTMSTYYYQPFLGLARVGYQCANFNSTTMSNFGGGANASEGTVSAIAMGSDQAGEANSIYTFRHRVRSTSGLATNNTAGWRSTGPVVAFGNSTGEGGFFVVMQGGTAQYQTGSRGFIGLLDLDDIPNNTAILSLQGAIGMGYDNQTTWRIISNDKTSTGTEHYDLGANFPTNVDDNGLLTIALYAPPGQSSLVYWYAKRVDNSGNIYEDAGQITSQLPAAEDPMHWQAYLSTGTSTSAVIFDFISAYVETQH